MQLAIITGIVVFIVAILLGIKLENVKENIILSISMVIFSVIYVLILSNIELDFSLASNIIGVNIISVCIILGILKFLIRARIKAINLFLVIFILISYINIVVCIVTPELSNMIVLTISLGIISFIISLFCPEEWY